MDADMDQPNRKASSSGPDPSSAAEIDEVQTSPTSTSSGTLYDHEAGASSPPPPSSPEFGWPAFWKALRSSLGRHPTAPGRLDQTHDVEKFGSGRREGGGRGDEPITEDACEKPQLITRSLGYMRSGYPNLATFLDSDEDFMQYRRFGYLQSRLLLEKQDDLRQLEAQLDKLDYSQQDSEPDNLFSRRDFGDLRKGLLSSIERKFCEYSDLLISAQQLQSFNRPTKSEHQSVLNYIHNEAPVFPEESEFTLCKEDLITLRPGREHAWLDRAIEKSLKWLRGPFTRPIEYLFCPKELKEKRSNDTQVYLAKERIEGCSSVVITLMIVLMLILPLYLLYHLVKHTNGPMTGHENAIYMGILLVFTLGFAATMSFFTKAKRHEILGAAAAYCAVLVVFLGNLDSTN